LVLASLETAKEGSSLVVTQFIAELWNEKPNRLVEAHLLGRIGYAGGQSPPVFLACLPRPSGARRCGRPES